MNGTLVWFTVVQVRWLFLGDVVGNLLAFAWDVEETGKRRYRDRSGNFDDLLRMPFHPPFRMFSHPVSDVSVTGQLWKTNPTDRQ